LIFGNEERFEQAQPVFLRFCLNGSIGIPEFLVFGPLEYIRGVWVDSTDDLLEVIQKRRHLIRWAFTETV
jgi:hypothetical protein